MLREQEHSNEVVRTKEGFDVIPQDTNRGIVSVRLSPEGFWRVQKQTIKPKENIPFLEPEDGWSTPYSLYNYYHLTDYVVYNLYTDWVSPKPSVYKETKETFTPQAVTKWMLKQTGRCLGKKMKEEWAHGINSLDPRVLAVHKRAYNICQLGFS